MKNLIFIYDYFYPAYKAGGPVQSLTNMIVTLQQFYELSVISSAYDLNDTEPLQGIKTDSWTSTEIPCTDKSVRCWYATNTNLLKAGLKNQISDIKPSVVYLNGIFSFRFVIIPLLSLNKSNTKLVICPRGMLQAGALSGKAFKKKIYLAFLKISGLVKNITWHATNEAEARDINKVIGINAKCLIAPNIPKRPLALIVPSGKVPNKLRLIYLSLITEKKNLYGLIEIISKADDNITLDIYGPVKDDLYWEKCKSIIKNNPTIIYKGDVRPENVQQVFGQYDASILLTKGENFGHALYESLSAGRPIITSHFTPWNELDEKKAGWNIDIGNSVAVIDQLKFIAEFDQVQHQVYCNGAYKLAKEYYDSGDFVNAYRKLFG